MSTVQGKSFLSETQIQLLNLMQEINFGRIESLAVQDGKPTFNPTPVIVREIKFGSGQCTSPGERPDCFALKSQCVELFHEINKISNGLIESIEVKHGLPFRMVIKETRKS